MEGWTKLFDEWFNIQVIFMFVFLTQQYPQWVLIKMLLRFDEILLTEMKSRLACWLISNHLSYNSKIQFAVPPLANHEGIIMQSLLSTSRNNQCKNYWKFKYK